MRRSQLILLGVLLICTAALYLPSLHFGFIWDDPFWFSQVVRKPVWELFGPSAGYHFYRPGTLLIQRAFARRDGTLAPVIMHAFHIGVHLLNVVLIIRLCRDLRVPDPIPLLTAAIFGFYPLMYQAVVWLQSPQAWAVLLILLTTHLYIVARRRNSLGWLALSLLAFAFGLLVQESVVQVLPLLLFVEWQWKDQKALWRRRTLWPVAALTIAYLALWNIVPRAPGIVSRAFERDVAWYLLQGIAFPLMGAPGGYPTLPGTYVQALIVLAILWLVATLIYQRRTWILVLGLGWYVTALFSTWAGLRYSYVQLSSRSFYLGAFGVAVTWAAALSPPGWTSRRIHAEWRALGLALTGVILIQSALLIREFNQLYQVGTSHLTELVEALRESDERKLLFVNYPDRYTFQRSPYPLGYWGVTLAPIAVPLDQFGALAHQSEHVTESISLHAIDHRQREEGPYYVDLRGVPTTEPSVYEAALRSDGVYLTRYRADGGMELDYVGSLSETAPGQEEALVRFGDVAELVHAEAWQAGEDVYVDLIWRALEPGSLSDLVFLHLAQPYTGLVAQADGAAGYGLFPLWTWQPGHAIHDVRRFVPLGDTIPPGEYDVYVGIYDSISLLRLPATLPDHTLAPANAYWIGRVTVEPVGRAPR